MSDVSAPYKYKALLVVEKPGYKSVSQLFQHGEEAHAAVVVLVPDARP